MNHNGSDGQGETSWRQARERQNSALNISFWPDIFFFHFMSFMWDFSAKEQAHVCRTRSAFKANRGTTQRWREGPTSPSYLVNRETHMLSGTISMHRMKSCDFQTPDWKPGSYYWKNQALHFKVELTGMEEEKNSTTCLIFADSDPFYTGNWAFILPSFIFFFSFRVDSKLLTTHTVLRAVHTAWSVYHSQLMLKINLQHHYRKLWQIVMCWHSHKLLVKKSNTSLFCHLMFEIRDGHIMQSLRVCKLHKCLGFTKQVRLWNFFLLQLGMCLLLKRLS